MVSIAVVVLLVALGETTGVFFGRRIRDRITGARSLQLDSTLGSVLQAVTVVLAAWLVALPLASASFPGLVAGVRGSEVLRAVDSVMPAGAKRLPSDLRQLLNNSGFPDVTSPFAETPITQVGPPNPALLQSPVVADAADSVLKIRGRAPSCSRQLEGTGFVIGPQLVMTNAHVVAGTAETGVEVIRPARPHGGARRQGRALRPADRPRRAPGARPGGRPAELRADPGRAPATTCSCSATRWTARSPPPPARSAR